MVLDSGDGGSTDLCGFGTSVPGFVSGGAGVLH
jgi:hypothetical protein